MNKSFRLTYISFGIFKCLNKRLKPNTFLMLNNIDQGSFCDYQSMQGRLIF